MNLPVKHPFSTAPETIESEDKKGRKVLTVRPHALTPVRAKWADFLSVSGVLAVLAGSLYGVGTEIAEADWEWLAALFGPMLTHPLQVWGFGHLLKKRREIKFTAETFSFKTLTGWKHYDRNLPHSFALYRHDKTTQELLENELSERRAAAKGEITQRKRYYAESFHVVFEYLGQRVDVVTIYGEKEARMVLNRLTACDAVIDAGLGKGKGAALTPEEDWADGPGTLPQK